MKSLLVSALPILCAACVLGCSESESAYVDRTEAQAQASQPVSTEVEAISIPADPDLPTLVLVVEPFVMGASGVTADTGQMNAMMLAYGAGQFVGVGGGGPVINPGAQIGPGVSAQLISALSRMGNVMVIDHASYLANPDQISANLEAEQIGPFLMKGTVTEFSEKADESGQGQSRGPGMGAYIPYVGPILALADSGKASSQIKRKGMVGFDAQIIDPKTGRIVASFTASGSFVSVSVVRSHTKWGKTETTTEYASSAIGQAQRQALNNAMLEIQKLIRKQKESPALAKN